MISSDLTIVGSYDYLLVVPSIVISILGAYAARDLFQRVSDDRACRYRAARYSKNDTVRYMKIF